MWRGMARPGREWPSEYSTDPHRSEASCPPETSASSSTARPAASAPRSTCKNALVPLRDEGGLAVGDDRLVPRLLLVGRDAERVAAVAQTAWRGGLDHRSRRRARGSCIRAYSSMPPRRISARPSSPRRSRPGGTSIPRSRSRSSVARGDAAPACRAGARPQAWRRGGQGLSAGSAEADRARRRSGFFGRIVGFRLEFGWWVFDGIEAPCQRPSWNYRRAGGGGLILDMYPHWRYVIERILGPIARVVTVSHRPQRRSASTSAARAMRSMSRTPSATLVELAERCGRHHPVVVGDAGAARRSPDLAGRRYARLCDRRPAPLLDAKRRRRRRGSRISASWSISGIDYRVGWSEVAAAGPYTNPYRVGWEEFLRHVAADAPLRSDLAAGIRDVQFAEACHRSMREGTWVKLDAPS